jgi:medium-chain acyl-[acyl-carrier-protein] hydrolase
MQLFCLPYAGAGASAFRCMKEVLPRSINVCPLHLPGREHRYSAPLINNSFELIPQLAQQLQSEVNGNYAIYGHSMGSLLGFELIRFLRRQGFPLPIHFFAAARGAPSLSGEYEHFSNLDDDEFITRIRQFGGLPEKIITNKEIMNIVLPVLRSDFKLLDSYQYFEEPPLLVPLTSIHGVADATVQSAWVQTWQYETSSNYRHHSIKGNHFFINDRRSPVFEIITNTLHSKCSDTSPTKKDVFIPAI